MRARRFPYLTVLVLLAVGALFGRSYVRSDVVAFFTLSGNLQAAGSDRGQLWLFISGVQFPDQSFTFDRVACSHAQFQQLMDVARDNGYPPAQFVGFVFGRADSRVLDPPNAWYAYAAVPTWLPAGLAGLLFALRLRGYLRYRHRRASGLCLNCGYDLRATPDPSGPSLPRCPECGREIAEKGKNA